MLPASPEKRPKRNPSARPVASSTRGDLVSLASTEETPCLRHSRLSGERTRERILDIAERLFAEAGLDGVSMRQIGSASNVPFALVTHHFGSKLGLYKAVFKRQSGVLTTLRTERLRSIEIGGDAAKNFAAIADAIVEPLMHLRETQSGLDFSRVLGREINDPREGERGIVEEYFDPIAALTIELLRKAAPDAPAARAHWAYYFAVGALAIIHSNSGRVERISNGLNDTRNVKELTHELSCFMAAGFAGSLLSDSVAQSDVKQSARDQPGSKQATGQKITSSRSLG